MLLYSVPKNENAPQIQGVALMLSKEARNVLIGLESCGPRIIKASSKTNKEGLTVNDIQYYALTTDNDEDKDNFYGSAVDHRKVVRKRIDGPDRRPKHRSHSGQHRV
ncbi:unnamed protein product [Schistosoma mattheei]|uniref:Uncharacterized protein n=1 Tax=Schistosoma mattheei TaxID=31246 RepID=A0A183NN78_9TREM|nr:unnamed protein product [Schistosoma mattheei]